VKKKFLAPIIAALCIFIIYSSCTKIDTTDLGNELIPAVDNVTTFDTVLDVITDNFFLADSTRITRSENHALGAITNDPVFGKTTASIYVNLRPQNFGKRPFSDSTITLDSVVLSLAYKGTYGDTLGLRRFNIHEIDLTEKTRFRDSSNAFPISHPPLQTAGLLKVHDQDLTKLNDEYKIREGSDTALVVKNQLRIRLNNSFGQRFINYDTTAAYQNDSIFKTKFLGLAIIPDSNLASSNALSYFNLIDQTTKLTFYYKAKYGSKDSVMATSFIFSNATNINRITRNTSGTEYSTAIGNPSTSQDKLYIQSSPGSYASIRIPGLSTLSNRVVHRAELITESLASLGDDRFKAPPVLFLDAIDSAAKLTRTIQNDFVINQQGQYNFSSFGGFVSRDGTYSFNISRYVQGIVSRKETSYTLRIYAPYETYSVYINPGIQNNGTDLVAQKEFQMDPRVGILPLRINPQIAAGRTVLAGGSHPTKKMRLRIIYSRI